MLQTPVAERRGSPWARHTGLPLGAMLAFTLVGALTLHNTQYFAILTLAAIFGIVAVSLDLLLGYAGQLSLGQTVPFGVGAYVSAILTTTHGWPPEAAAVAAVLAAAALAAITSPILRLEGFYFALASLALVLIFEAVSRNWLSVTGGSSGFVGIGYLRLGPFHVRSTTDYFVLAWIVLVLVTLLSVNVTKSRVGRGLLAIHEDARAAAALGVPVASVKIRVWLLSAAMAGLAGVLYAHYIRFLSPEQFGQVPAIILVVAVVIGGTGTIYGAIVGVVIVRLLPALFDGFAEHSVLVYGIAVIVVTVAWPLGIVGTIVEKLRVRAARPPGEVPA